MKKLLLISLFFNLIFTATGQHFHWVKTGINTSGSSNVAGGTSIVATTNARPAASSTKIDLYNLAVSDTSGALLWSKNIFCLSQINQPPGVDIDNNQNVIIAGAFRDSLFIENTLFNVPAINGNMFYVVKYNINGTRIWARSSTFNIGQNISSVNTSTDAAGNVYVSGSFTGTLTIGTLSLTATSGSSDAFLVKYDENGNLLWAQKAGTTDAETIIKSKTAPNGTTYLASTTPGTVPIGATKQLLTKFDTNGILLWNRTITPAGNSNVSLAIDNANNLYLSGNYTSSIDFTSTFTLTSLINYQTFLAKYSSNGNFKWAKNIATGTSFTTSVPSIVYTTDNTLGIAGSFNGTATFGTTQLSSAPSGSKNSFIVKTDTAGTLLWSKIIPGVTGENVINGITGNNRGTYYVGGLINGEANFSGATVKSSTSQTFIAQLKAVSGNVTTGSLFNLVSGTIFLDANVNGVRDANEQGVAGVFTGASSNSFANFTSPAGNYNLFLPAGNFTITPVPKRYHTFVPATQTAAFSGTNQTLNGKDFAMQAIPNQTDVRVILTNIAAARPGFNFSYNLSFQNVGTNTISDTLTLNYDPLHLYFNNSTNIPVTQQNGQLKWYYSNLQPNESRIITANFNILATTSISNIVSATSIIKPLISDLYQADNFSSTQVTVTGSFDPNDKQVDKPVISLAAVSQGEYLDYTIRFQNTGTDTAFTVTVSDKISANLQMSTLETLSSSHPHVLSLNGGSNTVEWRFNNILLPDSARNEPASHGFIRFRIKTKPGLVLGDSIANKAAIYFDYNTPVNTNYAITKVSNLAGIRETIASENALKLYPNPTQNYVILESKLLKNTAISVRIINTLGQKVTETFIPAQQQTHYKLPLNNLSKGIYILQIETSSGIEAKRLVIQ